MVKYGVKFKVGNRIIFVETDITLNNQRGKIIYIDITLSLPYAIEFDKNVEGHMLGTYGAPEVPIGHGLWCYEIDLELDHVYYTLEYLTK